MFLFNLHFLAQTCPPGHALDVNSNKCKKCSPGTAAPGDIFEVNYWASLPSGFYSDILADDASACSR